MPPYITVHAEDAQPNELRKASKGASGVPAIQVTSELITRRPTNSARGGSFGRGRPHRGSTNQSYTDRYPSTKASASGSPYSSRNTATHIHPRGRPPNTQHAYRQSRYHDPIDSAHQTRSYANHKRHFNFPEEHIHKRLRIQPLPIASTSHLTAPDTTPDESAPPSSSLCREIMLDLPPECFNGISGCKLLRRQWRECETRKLEHGGQTEVYHVESMDRHMRFFCRSRGMSQIQTPGKLKSIFAM